MRCGRERVTHREDVDEGEEEERRVRPAGVPGGPERGQHQRDVVHHRHLRYIHRPEKPSAGERNGNLGVRARACSAGDRSRCGGGEEAKGGEGG